MKGRAYKRKRGDFEVRVLSDGRVVMVAPDEALLEIARTLEMPASPKSAWGRDPSARRPVAPPRDGTASQGGDDKEQSQPMEDKDGRATKQTAG